MNLNLGRWSTSFADLALLLLGFFVLLHAANGKEQAVLASARVALGGPTDTGRLLMDENAGVLFARGEARLTPASRSRLTALGDRVGTSRIQIESSAGLRGAARFDRWELAAARAAAVARAIREGGVAEDRIDIVIAKSGQANRIVVRRV